MHAAKVSKLVSNVWLSQNHDQWCETYRKKMQAEPVEVKIPCLKWSYTVVVKRKEFNNS